MKSEDYMKGWRDGIKEARERGDKKFEEFIKRLKEDIKNASCDESMDYYDNCNFSTFEEIIDKLAGEDLK